MVKHLPDGGVVARSSHGRTDVMFGPVITTEAHLAFAGASVHSNNTAEMSAIVEALSFLGPMARLPVMRTFLSMIPNMLLAQDRPNKKTQKLFLSVMVTVLSKIGSVKKRKEAISLVCCCLAR